MCSLAEKRLLAKIISYFRSKITSPELHDDQKESLEVAVQCLESTFGVNSLDPALQTNIDLLSIFAADTNSKVPTDSEKAEAENLKNTGNDLMKAGKFEEAVRKYSEAIHLFASPIFFCNRAAAYSKLERHSDAVDDCRIALSLDATYSKAYGRMGLAYSCMNKFPEARDAYKKALEIEPGNESFQNNLMVAEEKLRETGPSAGPGFGGMPGMGGGGMLDMFNNPVLLQMAQQMMTDPNMQNMISGMFGGMNGGGVNPASGVPNPAQPNTAPHNPIQNNQVPPTAPAGGINLNNLMEMGQRFASMMQQQNPDLVNQLRQQYQQDQHEQDPSNPGNQQPPKNPPPS